MKKESEVLLTEEEVVDTLEALNRVFSIQDFANGYRAGAYTPYMQNDLMKKLNINTQEPNKENIKEALDNPSDNEDKLVSYNQSFYFNSLMYKRNHEYLANLPSFDLEFSCINASKEDYSTSAYKKDYKKVKEFLDKFDYRTEFKNVLWNLLMSETYFCMFREFETKSTLQDFPWKYAMVTGRFEYGLLYDVDMSWFLQPQVDINCYPDFFKKKYKEMFVNGKAKDYVPSRTVNKRTGTFGLWTQTSPEDGFWCFKFNQKHNLQVPFYSAMLPEMSIVPLMRNLQVSQSMAAARKLLVSEIPYLQDKRSSSVANQLAIDADVLGKFLGLATQGLEAAIKVLALPTEDIKGIEFQNTDKDTYEKFMSVTSSLLSGGKVIFSTSTRTNVYETQLSLNLDELLVESVYPQFADFLNYYVNKKTKKFKWVFRFVGCNDFESKKRRREEVMAYADKGIVLPNKLASTLGLNKIELERELEEAQATGFTDKLLQMINLNTSSSKTSDSGAVGRPRKDSTEISESGALTQATGANIEKGGEV